VLHTPGHTYESISLALYDTSFCREQAIGVFTGDALFIGDVGRTDFFPDKRRQAAELLYDSIFDVILPLGDSVILYPAHGSGSVCGSGMASREFSTLGYEHANNPMLQMDRDAFAAYKAAEHHYQPPYFKKMEQVNRDGIGLFEPLPVPAPMGAGFFAEAIQRGTTVVDVRSPEAFAGGHIPYALSLPMSTLASYAGWYLSYDRPIGLVVENNSQVQDADEHLFRIGYDNILGYLAGGMSAWETSGRHYDTVGVIDAASLKDRIERHEPFTLLDVRSIGEFNKGHLPGARHIFVGELPQHLDDLPRAERITTYCGSGRRAMIAASILKAADFEQVEDCLGSMRACKAIGCPITA
jgi:hydroxyacylglutathione hydrolase